MSRLYFEMEVVKVKKEKCEHKTINMASNNKFYCGYCGEELFHKCKKGNWINGENLDKIKFPCFCSYVNTDLKGREIGQINKGRNYELFHVGKQGETNYVDGSFQTLKALITIYNIHILKGKIIIYEEEKV